MSAKNNFNGKVILITGSSAGIGAVTAEEFAKAGAQVVINGRNLEKLAEVGEKCLKASAKGLKALEVVADVTNEEDCKRLIDSTIKAFGKLDVLVNNAAVGVFSSIFDAKILQDFDRLMQTNVRSVICLTQLSAKHLEKTKGNIVNISSSVGLKPISFAPLYCMSKCALDMFTKTTALELGPKGIRVNAINPAVVRTNFIPMMGMDEHQYEAFIKEKEKAYPLGRVGEPIDVANTILFIASDECSWVTGINFLQDGGGIDC